VKLSAHSGTLLPSKSAMSLYCDRHADGDDKMASIFSWATALWEGITQLWLAATP